MGNGLHAVDTYSRGWLSLFLGLLSTGMGFSMEMDFRPCFMGLGRCENTAMGVMSAE